MAQLDLTGWPENLQQITDLIGQKYSLDGLLGEGKTGAAYKLSDRASKRCFCLKTIATKVETAKRSDVRDTLKKEVAILDPLSHRAIPEVFERDLECDLPFYVCTYHPGKTFIAFKQEGRKLSTPEAIFVIEQLIDALRYLHDRGRTHCDFHQNNILIHEDVFTNGVLIIDFGSGHRESDSSESTLERGDFRYKSLEAQARYRANVVRSKGNQGFRAADFSAFGHLLGLMAESFFGSAPRDQQIAYGEFCHQLRTGEISDWVSARTQFAAVIDPGRLVTSAERLFISDAGTRQSIRIPVSGDVPVGEAILSVVNSTAFQKLKGLKQLSFCEWLYVGGVHTRFEHSLGVMNVTWRALSRLAYNPRFRDKFTPENIQGALLASLVHDIGHYPFAHVIEHYVASRFPSDKEAKALVHHARFTLDLIDNDKEVRRAIDQHWGDDIRHECAKVLEGIIPVISELLDGPIDCDKLDYLQRDAHHCGVPFGAGIDVERIVSSFRYLESSKLGIDRSAVTAVEGLMVTQEQMLDTVYWNETIRGVTVMFHAVIATIVKTDKSMLESLVADLRNCVNEYEALVKVILPRVAKVSDVNPSDLKPLYNLHLEPRFTDIYIPIKKYTAADVVPNKSIAHLSIYHSILRQPLSQTSTVPIEWTAVRRLRECYRTAFAQQGKGDSIGLFDILVDVPWGKAGNRVVYVTDDGINEVPIVDVSHLDSTIFDRPTMHLAPIRVFVSPRLFLQHEQHLQAVALTAEAMFYDAASLSETDDRSIL